MGIATGHLAEFILPALIEKAIDDPQPIDQKTRISVSKSGIRANTPVMRIIKKKLLTSTTFDAAWSFHLLIDRRA
jgi:hypothetical protein